MHVTGDKLSRVVARALCIYFCTHITHETTYVWNIIRYICVHIVVHTVGTSRYTMYYVRGTMYEVHSTGNAGSYDTRPQHIRVYTRTRYL